MFIGPASARSYKIGVIGNNWLVGWLVGNAVFSEMALRIFLIFCMKLRDYKGRKVTEPDFWKKLLIWRYSLKGLQIKPKSDTFVFFSKTALTTFLVFRLRLVLNMTFNLSQTYFPGKLLAIISTLGLMSSCFLTIHRSSRSIFFYFVEKTPLHVVVKVIIINRKREDSLKSTERKLLISSV